MSKLSGLVAIVRNGVVVEIRDLGPTPIDVKPGVVRPLTIVENDTSTGETQTVTTTVDDIQPDRVTRTITTRDVNAGEASDIDLGRLNSALAEKGSVVRALAELMLVEINKLRVKNGDAAYTKEQFVTALRAKMR